MLTAQNGQHALSLHEKADQKIDLVVSDMMPQKSGIELFHDLKVLTEELKFILDTGYSLKDLNKQVLDEIERCAN